MLHNQNLTKKSFEKVLIVNEFKFLIVDKYDKITKG